MTAVAATAAFGAAFVATHLLMSHPLRQPLARALGARAFQLLYSLVALLTFGGMIWARRDAGPEEWLWQPAPWAWAVTALLTWFASILLVGSFVRNPAMVTFGPGSAVKIGEPAGVLRITRHPMMWSFGLWAISHLLVHSEPSAVAVAITVLVMALTGSAGQDVKKRHLGAAWSDWVARTSFFPFGHGFALPGWPAFLGGTLLFLAATWLHPSPVGLWQWLS